MNLNKELIELYEEDQKDRFEKLYETDPKLFSERDTRRLSRAKEIYLKKDELTPERLCDLAMLFQHGLDSEDYKKAFELTNKATQLGYEDAKWLSAASEDRHLLSIGKKQKWGTQFKGNGEGGWEQSPMYSDDQSRVTDEMRKEMGVPIRSEQLKVFLEKYNS